MSTPTPRVDHTELSEQIMGALNENIIGEEGITDATIVATAIDALRHATLALAEEQRVANLVAIVTATYPNGSGALMALKDAAATEVVARYGPDLGVEPFQVSTR